MCVYSTIKYTCTLVVYLQLLFVKVMIRNIFIIDISQCIVVSKNMLCNVQIMQIMYMLSTSMVNSVHVYLLWILDCVCIIQQIPKQPQN